LTAAVAGALPDAREAGKVRHSLLAVVRQRAFGIGNGYEDANDAARLRDDPTHQLLLGRVPGAGSELASQPTISRLENAFDEKQVAAACEAFSGAVLNRHQRRLRRNAKRIIIDVDGEREQYLVAALLRPGNAGNDQVLSFLSGVIENVKAHFPRVRVTLRADAGFALSPACSSTSTITGCGLGPLHPTSCVSCVAAVPESWPSRNRKVVNSVPPQTSQRPITSQC